MTRTEELIQKNRKAVELIAKQAKNRIGKTLGLLTNGARKELTLLCTEIAALMNMESKGLWR